jgi:hypothetical protein
MNKNTANEYAKKIVDTLLACDFLEISKSNIIKSLIIEFFAENPNFNDKSLFEMLKWAKTCKKVVNWLDIENALQRVTKTKKIAISSDETLTTKEKKAKDKQNFFNGADDFKVDVCKKWLECGCGRNHIPAYVIDFANKTTGDNRRILLKSKEKGELKREKIKKILKKKGVSIMQNSQATVKQ